jgi:DNA-binding NtrC family response regulator
MPSTRQTLPDGSPGKENLTILLISPFTEDEKVFQEMFPPGASMSLSRVNRVEEALPQICATTPSLVICERDLPDGSWKTILGACEALQRPTCFLVASRQADERLWAEVLNLGGFDVLQKPFKLPEIRQVLDLVDQGRHHPSLSAPNPESTSRPQFA